MFASTCTYTSGIQPCHLQYKKMTLCKFITRKEAISNDGMVVDITGVEKYTSSGNRYIFDVIHLVHRLEGKSRER